MFHLLHRIVQVLFYGTLVAAGVYVFQQREWFEPVIDRIEIWRNHSEDQKKVIEEVSGEVIKVIDGNTVQVKGVPGLAYFRLAGTDVPNLRNLNNRHEYARAAESKTNLTRMVLSNEVQIKILQTNQFGYASAVVFRDGTNINARVVEEGMARVNPKYLSNLPTRERKAVLRAEEKARERQVGVWGMGSSDRRARTDHRVE